jgi:threonine 3-dehydrogenase
MIVGHEFAGEIVEIGIERAPVPLRIGQRVSGEGHIIDLDSAAGARRPLPPRSRHPRRRRQPPGRVRRISRVSPRSTSCPCPMTSTYEVGAMLDPFGNAVHTAQQFDLMGEDVLVTGAGPIGIMAAAVARRAAHAPWC